VPVDGAVGVGADNPGRWLFHCHNLYNMETRMITEIAHSEASPEPTPAAPLATPACQRG
jgi:hypothetical protein